MVYAAPLLIDDVESLERFLLGFLLIGTCTCVLIILSPGFNVKNGRLGIDIGGGFRTNPLAIGELGGMLLMTGVLCTRPAGSVVASSVLRTAACLFGGYLALQSGSRGQLIFALLISMLRADRPKDQQHRPVRRVDRHRGHARALGDVGSTDIPPVGGPLALEPLQTRGRGCGPEQQHP
jgi:hypothetical protein